VKVEIVPVDSLTLAPDNVNTHTNEQIEELAASLKEFGQQSPLVVRHDGVVLRGNGVLKAARNLGMTDIAIVRSDLVGSHALGYAVADNRLAEKSQRDSAKLLSALEELVDDVPLDALGFSHEEIDALSDEVEQLLMAIDPSKVVLDRRHVEPLRLAVVDRFVPAPLGPLVKPVREQPFTQQLVN
jgi:hypothetical protein